MASTINVSIVSDVVCPFCFLGKRRFEKAVAAFQAKGNNVIFNVKYLPFELGRELGLTKEGVPTIDTLIPKMGKAGVAAMMPRMIQTGKQDGILFNFGGLRSSTLDAHRLLHLALQSEIQNQVAEGLFSAYHEGALNIGDDNVLADVYEKAGGDRNAALAYLKSDQDVSLIRSMQKQALLDGVTSVPHFNIEGLHVSGAQESQAFERIFEKVLQKGRAEPA
ncbi:hypothetical protein BASA50_010294 [Batrachochytrium salamandrivorans]|uniref:DSBA-like thioredoxin domain-containing protein n=1 Tax=Batrachochytrium salamandrivorans TaxID=1357716 RepID=A0ABQ8EYW8_9FUNG|nr:hypothetical protein BASA60_008254 [Batrachochytrium salamandrivorans]KAH6574184.1 hypothetical protein BASA62_002575 [Batrachochytrium salamandrivorans]KAH6583416.1 hypothetical protein BASA61_008034 [Batrachochytrium salamandrivorans]KAH6589065.1 hypothetical protein BASA50_010294 [Batrachochytrium salamandrivorans]KAH9263764.1 hypothetical protein BASA83_012840 [Batrachochytrium salamandrivorans]